MFKPRAVLTRSPVGRQALLAFGLVTAVGLAATSNAEGGAPRQAGAQAAGHQPPADKQTTLGLYVTAKEAYEQCKTAPDKVMILDVRTPEEYLFVGHADMAWNIPVAAQSYQWDATKKQFPMQPLPDFVARVSKVAKPDDQPPAGCC